MKHILLFDRALLVRMRIKEILANEQVKIHEVESEAEVINMVMRMKTSLDLLIMDIANDLSDGYELVTRIKQMNPNLPIVILTSSNKRGDFIKGIQSGATDYILKPFEDESFKNRITTVLNNIQSTQPAALGSEPASRALRSEQAKIAAQPMDKATEPEVMNHKESTFLDLLKAEKYKAKKGRYPISVFALIFEKQSADVVELTEVHFQDIRAQLWESDEFIHYGPHLFYGILPFCHDAGFERFKEKMTRFLNDEAKEKNFYHQYHWHVIGITLSEGEYDNFETTQILEYLNRTIKAQIQHH